MSESNFFCHLPFVSIDTDGRHASPCCAFTSRPIPLDSYESNPIIIDTKQKLFRGIQPEGCIKCVEAEKLSGKSFRILANEFHPHYTKEVLDRDDTYSSLKIVNVVGSNICNLKCLPCYGPSYVRDKELFQLGLINSLPQVKKLENISKIIKSDIEQITLCAGEPFYDRDSWNLLKALAITGQSKQIRVDINTNLTHITDEKLDFLSHNFDSVWIKGSIDGIGAVNDYLRYPSQWHTIEKSVDLILSRPEISFVVTTALSNLSLLRYHELFAWVQSKKIHNCFITQVTHPKLLSCNNLPDITKQNLKMVYQNLQSTSGLSDRTSYALEICSTLCQNSKPDKNFSMPALSNYLDLHDNHRGTNWRIVFPEIINIS
jgi:sulfatase maturation enzyme AslB (radical SAM superfamily)